MAYNALLATMREQKRSRDQMVSALIRNHKQLEKAIEEFNTLQDAQQVLTTVSEENTTAVLDFVTEVINRTLGEIFKGDRREIKLKKSVRSGKYVHINVDLVTSEGISRSLTLQSGTGLRQIVSFLYILSLIEVRKDRRLVMMDEILSGLHSQAKGVITEIISLFADSGFQFIMVEYGIDDLGKIYNVEKPGPVARVYSLGEDQEYTGEMYMFTEGFEELELSNSGK